MPPQTKEMSDVDIKIEPGLALNSSSSKPTNNTGGGVSKVPSIVIKQEKNELGALHMMGNITKKLVITPNHQLGIKKAKLGGSKRPSNNNHTLLSETVVDDDIMDITS